MKTPVFTGTCTALITPFQASGSIDYAAFARQMDRQLESGVDALCVCGTTGESSTLTVQEHVHLVDYCVSHVAGRHPPRRVRRGIRRRRPSSGHPLL